MAWSVQPSRRRSVVRVKAAQPTKPSAPTHAGLVVKANDTGRILMLQRALTPDDPAAGMWEFPGGQIEPGETAAQGAHREWSEETGAKVPDGLPAGGWVSPNGVYQAFIHVIPHEGDLSINTGTPEVLNPDDPDQDCIETVAFFDPKHLPGMPSLRPACRTSDWDAIDAAKIPEAKWSVRTPSRKAFPAVKPGQPAKLPFPQPMEDPNDPRPQGSPKERGAWRVTVTGFQGMHPDHAGKVEDGDKIWRFNDGHVEIDHIDGTWSNFLPKKGGGLKLDVHYDPQKFADEQNQKVLDDQKKADDDQKKKDRAAKKAEEARKAEEQRQRDNEQAKVPKEKVHYRKSSEPSKRCGTCSMYLNPGKCSEVRGAISPGDVCDRWEPKEKKWSIRPITIRRVQVKYSQDQPRDDRGRFGSGGGLVPSHAELQTMSKVPGPMGSNPAEWRQSLDGRSFIVKPTPEDRAQNEVAAGAVYRAAGIPFPKTGVVYDDHGKPFVVSEKVGGLGQHSAHEWAQHPDWQKEAAKDFGTDALLSHWDVHGLVADNTLIDSSGKPVRIESGGAMAFRAMGAPKPTFAVGQPWVEPTTMRTSDQGKAMYGKMSDRDVADSLERAGKIDLDKVKSDWLQQGVSKSNADKWSAVLKERQAQIPALVDKLRGPTASLTDRNVVPGLPSYRKVVGDRTAQYQNTDLHHAGVWGPSSASDRYGAVVFNDKGEVLLREPANHFDGYNWTFAKGHPDGDEHPTTTAIRETAEETGKMVGIVGHVPGGFSGSGTGSKNFYYLAKDSGDTHPEIMNNETWRTQWAGPDEAAKLISQSTNTGGRNRDLATLKAANAEIQKYLPPKQSKMWRVGRRGSVKTEFFTEGGVVHPIRNSDGYDGSVTTDNKPSTKPSDTSQPEGKPTTPPSSWAPYKPPEFDPELQKLLDDEQAIEDAHATNDLTAEWPASLAAEANSPVFPPAEGNALKPAGPDGTYTSQQIAALSGSLVSLHFSVGDFAAAYVGTVDTEQPTQQNGAGLGISLNDVTVTPDKGSSSIMTGQHATLAPALSNVDKITVLSAGPNVAAARAYAQPDKVTAGMPLDPSDIAANPDDYKGQMISFNLAGSQSVYTGVFNGVNNYGNLEIGHTTLPSTGHGDDSADVGTLYWKPAELLNVTAIDKPAAPTTGPVDPKDIFANPDKYVGKTISFNAYTPQGTLQTGRFTGVNSGAINVDDPNNKFSGGYSYFPDEMYNTVLGDGSKPAATESSSSKYTDPNDVVKDPDAFAESHISFEGDDGQEPWGHFEGTLLGVTKEGQLKVDQGDDGIGYWHPNEIDQLVIGNGSKPSGTTGTGKYTDPNDIFADAATFQGMPVTFQSNINGQTISGTLGKPDKDYIIVDSPNRGYAFKPSEIENVVIGDAAAEPEEASEPEPTLLNGVYPKSGDSYTPKDIKAAIGPLPGTGSLDAYPQVVLEKIDPVTGKGTGVFEKYTINKVGTKNLTVTSANGYNKGTIPIMAISHIGPVPDASTLYGHPGEQITVHDGVGNKVTGTFKGISDDGKKVVIGNPQQFNGSGVSIGHAYSTEEDEKTYPLNVLTKVTTGDSTGAKPVAAGPKASAPTPGPKPSGPPMTSIDPYMLAYGRGDAYMGQPISYDKWGGTHYTGTLVSADSGYLTIKPAGDDKPVIEVHNSDLKNVKVGTPLESAASTAKVADLVPDTTDRSSSEYVKGAGFLDIDKVRAYLNTPEGGVRGMSIPYDGKDLEDLDLRATRVVDSQGKPTVELKFKLRDDAKTALRNTVEASSSGWKTTSMSISKKHVDASGGNYKLSSGDPAYQNPNGKTARGEIGGAKVEYHYATSQHGSSTPRAFDGLVQVRIPEAEFNEAKVSEVLHGLGVRGTGYAQPDDVKQVAAAKLDALFKGSEGQKVRSALGNPTVEDVKFGAGAAGKVEVHLSSEQAAKISKYTGINSFTHDWAGDTDDLVKALAGAGAVSTTTRWTEGIGKSGASSDEDTHTGGADYVFTRPTSDEVAKPYSGGRRIVYDAKPLMERTDYFSTPSDTYGKTYGSSYKTNDTMAALQEKNWTGSPETMFKNRISNDAIRNVFVPSSSVDKMVADLKAAGVTTLGGRNVEDVVKSSGSDY